MKSKRKYVALSLALILLLGILSGCSEKSEKVTVICTVFPIYDWVRQVVGDSDGVEVKLLVSDGTDMHSFQPTAKDAIDIRTADIIVRVGGVDDSFVTELARNGQGADLRLMEAEGVTLRHRATDSEHSHSDGHDHAVDEHIWLSLRNAAVCVEAIRVALTDADPENADLYRQNADLYTGRLRELDEKYESNIEKTADPKVIFADRFPFVYLTSDYGIEYEAAFEGCSAETGASFDTILRLSKRLDEWKLSCLFVTETSDRALYDAICDVNKDRKIRPITLDSMQSVKASDIESGTTYIGIMENNLEALMGALLTEET